MAHAGRVRYRHALATMRILAASFRDRNSAHTAQARLVRQLAVDSGALRIASLGKAGRQAEPATILAGNFREEVVNVARDVIESFGGIMVVDVDEKRTHA
jgi:hypothetical protein